MFKTRPELSPFFQLFRRHWKQMALGALLGFTTIAAGVGLLSLSGWFISATAFAGLTLTGAQLFNFFYPSIGIRLFAVIRTAARYAERVISHDATFRLLQSLRCWFYRHIEPLAPACLMPYRSGDILQRIVADIEALDNLYLRVLSPSVVAVLMSFMVLLFLWIFDPLIALSVFIFLFAAGFGVPALVAGIGAAIGRDLARQSADLRIYVVEMIQGMPEILVFGARHRYLEKVRRKNQQLLDNQLRMSHLKGLATAALTLLSGTAAVTAVYIGAGLVHRHLMDGANLALLGLAVLAAFEAVWPLPAAYQYLGRTLEAGRRLLEIAHTQPAPAFASHPFTPPKRLDVKFERVSFRYTDHDPPALDGVDIEFSHGQRTMILGETGCGKSTLVNLLVRFWNPTAGRILIGGKNIRSLSEPDLRRLMAVVSQPAHMFHTSLRENLCLASSGATEDELNAALQSAQLLDFVKSLPAGLDTCIGESGKLLSTGQARRLAVARAILRDAPIWVLDEPTEGLDRMTAQKMMDALYELMSGRTVLLITHRIMDLNLHRMDKIVVLDKGRIAGQGPHETLLRTNKRYASLYARIYDEC
jgi:ATP-binding cassette subfamily C protein CydC